MNTSTRRYFEENLKPLADAIARLDIDQTVREAVAAAVANAIGPVRMTTQARPVEVEPMRELFWRLASDPLSPCLGQDANGCPYGREIRTAMHYSGAPDGRSQAWAERMPAIKCVACGPIIVPEPEACPRCGSTDLGVFAATPEREDEADLVECEQCRWEAALTPEGARARLDRTLAVRAAQPVSAG